MFQVYFYATTDKGLYLDDEPAATLTYKIYPGFWVGFAIGFLICVAIGAYLGNFQILLVSIALGLVVGVVLGLAFLGVPNKAGLKFRGDLSAKDKALLMSTVL